MFIKGLLKLIMRKQKSFKYQQTAQHFQTIRLGVKEHTIIEDIDRYYSLTLNQMHPHPPKIALLTNHEIVYLFNHRFQLNQQDHQETTLSELCQVKINLRLQYKLTLLHVKMQYSYNFQCVFVMLSNGQIAVFSDEFYLIGITEIVCCDPANSIKHCLDFQYYEKEANRSVRKIKTGLFLFLFSDCLQVHEVEMSSNHKLSKFKPSYKFTLHQLSKTISDCQIKHPVSLKMFSFFRSHLFEKGSEGLNNTAILCCNCRQEVHFYLINKDTLKIEQIVRITRLQLAGAHVGDCEISPQNKRFLIGLNNGSIRAISYKEESLGTVLYTIKISPSPVEKIYLQSSQKLLIYSKDCLLSVINLNTLSVQQTFRLGESTQFHFLNATHFLSLGNKSPSAYNLQQGQPENRALILNQFNCDYHKIFECNADVVSYSLQPERELIQLSDNSLLINLHKGGKVEVIQSYLPPKSVSVKCIQKNPFSEGFEYWILTEKSQIYKYALSSTNSVFVSEVVQLYRFLDRNGTEHRYIITFFNFLTRIVPLQYDSQTTEKQYLPNLKNNSQLKPLCLGTHTGQILIVSIGNMFQIICRMKSLKADVTNLIELHPQNAKDITKGLIFYESKRSERTIIVEMSSHTVPLELFRLSSNKGWMKELGKDLLAIMNGPAFNVFYCKEGVNECQIFKEEHYNPGLLQNSAITVISLCNWRQQQHLLVGYSLGQVSIYRMHRNINENAYLGLSMEYLIQNSKQEPLQFLRYQDSKLTFNLGSFLVWHSLPEHQDNPNNPNTVTNYQVNRNKGGKQFNFQQRVERQKKESIRSLNYISQQLSLGIKLPKIGKSPAKPKQGRSSSLSTLGREIKPQLMFHFPDIQLYRNLINRSIIH